MEERDLVINRLPAKTWNHLHMNETTVTGVQITKTGSLRAKLPDGVSLEQSGRLTDEYANISSGAGAELDQLAAAADIRPQLFVSGEKQSDHFLRLDFSYEAGDNAMNQVGLETRENAALDVVMDFTAPGDSEGLAAVQTKLYAGKNSRIRVVQIQRVGSGFTFLNDIGGVCEEGAEIELLQLVLSGHESYVGSEISLSGAESQLKAEIGYVVSGNDKLDMNYVVRHLGKQTNSEMNVAGALSGRGAKLFRGTIDFVNGASGSVGNEKEEVLLIDENTVNQTIPLILCAEEDVVGNHGASIGRPDEELLFYLSSRGIPEEAAYQMLSRAKLDKVCAKIWNEEVKQEIFDYMKGETDGEFGE